MGDTLDTVLHPAWLGHRTVVHLVLLIQWTVILVSGGLMVSLSVHLLSVGHLPPPPAPQAQCPLLTATPVSAAPWVSRSAPPPSAPPLPPRPPAPPCLAQTLAVSVSSPSPSEG